MRVTLPMKGKLSWKLFDGSDQLQDQLAILITQTTNEVFASITKKTAWRLALNYFNSSYLDKC